MDMIGGGLRGTHVARLTMVATGGEMLGYRGIMMERRMEKEV